MSMNKCFAQMKNLEVTWKGTSKNEKTGKERTSIQVLTRSPEGAVSTFYCGGNGALDPLKVGDHITEADVAVRSWNSNLYIDILKAQVAPTAKK